MAQEDDPDHLGEKWLRANDPNYDGETAPREIPWGSALNIEHLVERSLDPHRIHGVRGRPIVAAETKRCRRCEEAFTAKTMWQKFCSDACRKRAWKRAAKATQSDEE